MAKRFEIIYEKIEDILYIGKKEKVKFSIDIALLSGDLVVDIGFDGLVKGIEIMNASDFFSLSKEALSNIHNGKLSIVYSPSYGSITILLEKQGKPIKSNVVIPYSKKLALTA
jgi:uncharacterized protein YuzE